MKLTSCSKDHRLREVACFIDFSPERIKLFCLLYYIFTSSGPKLGFLINFFLSFQVAALSAYDVQHKHPFAKKVVSHPFFIVLLCYLRCNGIFPLLEGSL